MRTAGRMRSRQVLDLEFGTRQPTDGVELFGVGELDPVRFINKLVHGLVDESGVRWNISGGKIEPRA